MRPHSCTVSLVLLLYCTFLTGALLFCVLPSLFVVFHSLRLFTYWFCLLSVETGEKMELWVFRLKRLTFHMKSDVCRMK